MKKDYLGRNIKFLRERKGFSQRKLAKQVGISNTGISMYEKGKTNPDIGIIVVLAHFFGVTTTQLMHEEINESHINEHRGSKEGVFSQTDNLIEQFEVDFIKWTAWLYLRIREFENLRDVYRILDKTEYPSVPDEFMPIKINELESLVFRRSEYKFEGLKKGHELIHELSIANAHFAAQIAILKDKIEKKSIELSIS